MISITYLFDKLIFADTDGVSRKPVFEIPCTIDEGIAAVTEATNLIRDNIGTHTYANVEVTDSHSLMIYISNTSVAFQLEETNEANMTRYSDKLRVDDDNLIPRLRNQIKQLKEELD